MNYKETIDYLYSRLPMFTRIGAAAIKKDLTNTRELCSQLGDPQQKYPTIHVAGTNGKGSTSHMLAAILQTAGYKTGLYTSPHLRDFRERIRINGQMIPETEVVDFVGAQKAAIERIEPSFFEVTVAMAFDHFARHQVDIAVIEVGLGGRLDSTNIITPIVSVITNISYDHMSILGDTLPKIASEKAGIIKPGVPVVVSERQPDVEGIFREKAKSEDSPLVFASDEWSVARRPEVLSPGRLNLAARSHKDGKTLQLELDLPGFYQMKNVAGVLSAVNVLRQEGLQLNEQAVADGLKNVKGLTGLMGRWSQIGEHPAIVCDTGHNHDGIVEVLQNIQATPHKALHIVIGMVKDKDIRKVLGLLPATARYYFCRPEVERGKEASELAEEAREYGLLGNSFESVGHALAAAKKAADPEDLIFVGGSTFVVAEVI